MMSMTDHLRNARSRGVGAADPAKPADEPPAKPEFPKLEFHPIAAGQAQCFAHPFWNGDLPPDCYSCRHSAVLR